MPKNNTPMKKEMTFEEIVEVVDGLATRFYHLTNRSVHRLDTLEENDRIMFVKNLKNIQICLKASFN
jgi:hypothetical protein